MELKIILLKAKTIDFAVNKFKKGDFKFHKSYGYHTYDSITKVCDDHLFDLASITKTLASTLALMKLYDEKKLKLDNAISSFEKKLRKSNKKNTNFHELLIDQSGWITYINHQQFLKYNHCINLQFEVY